MVQLSVVTGTLDRPTSFKRLYDSVVTHTTVDYEFLVGDADILNRLDPTDWPKATIIPEVPRLGHIKGYNKLFSLASGEWVVWLNDDAEVCPGWDSCVSLMERNPWIGMGALAYSNLGGPYMVQEWHDMPYANFGIIRRELGARLQWFDDYLYFYGGDNSLSFKVFQAGMPVVPLNGPYIKHHYLVDSYRHENESKQAGDARILMEHYRQYLPLMQNVNRKFKRVAVQ